MISKEKGVYPLFLASFPYSKETTSSKIMTDPDVNSFLITDCGSTTTKAILVEKKDGAYCLRARGEAPTTVEAPHEDVIVGVLNSIAEIEELTGQRLVEQNKILSPKESQQGVDQYLSTSSAGGGLQMIVAGVVKSMTSESATHAALGAGAIVMDVFSSNDDRPAHEKIAAIRDLRPDMVLLAGGIDGGTESHVLEMAELLKAAHLKPRLDMTLRLPVIYGGNKEAAPKVTEILGPVSDLDVVPNIRPVLERENLQPAREKIHNLFMEHVMAQAPGYKDLMSWVHAPILPTPGAVGNLIQSIADEEGISVLGVDIGGATTDLFSVFGETFTRTVSANLGMSYSISNVLAEAGFNNIAQWLPFHMDESLFRNLVGNKMIRPTTIPQTLLDLQVEQAIAREALRLSLDQHKASARGLEGVRIERSISDIFSQASNSETLVNMMDLDLLIGSGGVLSHAPRRVQAARMMIDAFQPEGITELAVDSIFMMPHLGVLSTVHKSAASQVFHADCLVRLGTCVAPVGRTKPGKRCLTIRVELPGGSLFQEDIPFGDMVLVPLQADHTTHAVFTPARGFDLGAGRGVPIETQVKGGVLGLIIDCRGRRPFTIPSDSQHRISCLKAWSHAMGEYPLKEGGS